jgi:hypothetical protein
VPLLPPVAGRAVGSFTVPASAADQDTAFLRLTLTAQDSAGLTHSVSRDLRPTRPERARHHPVGVAFSWVVGASAPTAAGASQSEEPGSAELVATGERPSTEPAASGVTVFREDFTSADGWDTASDVAEQEAPGVWQRSEATDADGAANPCLVARASPGEGGGSQEFSVDSPAITLPASTELALSFRFYVARFDTASTGGRFRVSVIGREGAAVALEESGDAEAPSWAERVVDLSRFAGQTIRLRFGVVGEAPNHPIEAGLDDVAITRRRSPKNGVREPSRSRASVASP